MEYNAWLKQSTKDFEVAKKNYLNKDYYVVAFFCQQAVEKALKALSIKKNKTILKIHDLVKLAREVQASLEIIEKCSKITPVYFEVRYPESDELPADKVNKREADELLLLSEEVIQWVKKNI